MSYAKGQYSHIHTVLSQCTTHAVFASPGKKLKDGRNSLSRLAGVATSLSRVAMAMVISLATGAITASGCNLLPQCKDGNDPPEGSCTCPDGEQVPVDECSACSGSEPVDLGAIADTKATGAVLAACGRSYEFRADDLATVDIEISARAGSVTLTMEGAGGVVHAMTQASSGATARMQASIDAGRYKLRIATASAGTVSFELTLHTEPSDREGLDADPGNSPDSALEIGALTDVELFTSYVGIGDTDDYYKFELEANGAVTVAGRDGTFPMVVQLFPDATLIDKSKPLFTLNVPAGSDTLDRFVLERGMYYVRVSPSTASASGIYTLGLESSLYEGDEPSPEPGRDREHAHELGELEALTEYAGYVGPTDANDYYKFDLANGASVTFALTNVMGGVNGQLFKDAALIDVTNPLLDIRSTTSDAIQSTNLGKGTYVFRVTNLNSAASLYTLTFQTEPNS